MSGGASAQREEAGMTFDEILTQVLDLLRRDGRVSYRALKRRFDLDEDYLEDLKAEIIQAKKLAVDEAGAVLVWTGDAAMAPALVSDQERAPLAYTPSYLAEKILASRAALEGERKQVTVLFADLKGSTELIEGLDPEEARQLLDPALHVMMDAVHRYEGTVNQVLGDGFCQLVETESVTRQTGRVPGPSCLLGRPFCTRHLGPTRESLPHLLTVRRRGQQMPSRAEVLGDGSIRRQKTLRMPRRFKPLHVVLALACWPMGILTPIIEIATLAMFDPRQYLPLRRAVAL